MCSGQRDRPIGLAIMRRGKFTERRRFRAKQYRWTADSTISSAVMERLSGTSGDRAGADRPDQLSTPHDRVSIITIFLNEERFIGEAVDSVLAQTYRDWELLLVDDGSDDRSTTIARDYAQRHAGRIRYLDHAGHANRGMSASRNLGLEASTGDYVAFLDADDVWLPTKLADQVAILEAHLDVGVVCGCAEWWYSWTGEAVDRERDFTQRYRLPLNAVSPPPLLLLNVLEDEWSSPCDVLVRRDLMKRVGGYEHTFRGMYEDQAFHAKLALESPVFVSSTCWYRYRQHPDACTALSHQQGKTDGARAQFLEWLDAYLDCRTPTPKDVKRVVRRMLWPSRHPNLDRIASQLGRLTHRLRGALRLDEAREGAHS